VGDERKRHLMRTATHSREPFGKIYSFVTEERGRLLTNLVKGKVLAVSENRIRGGHREYDYSKKDTVSSRKKKRGGIW